MNVIEATNKNYGSIVILISCLDIDLINKICNDINTDLNFIYITKIDDKIKDLIKNKENILISGISFPTNSIYFHVDYHINVSLNKVLFANIKNKYNYKENYLQEYKKLLETNHVNKYINIKQDFDFDNIANLIFYLIIDQLEKKLYKKSYDKNASKYYLKYLELNKVEKKDIKSESLENTDTDDITEINTEDTDDTL